jgi:TP901 family phage tail tape measure protein
MSDNLLEFVLDMKVAGSAASASAIGQVDAAAVAAKRGAEALDRQIIALGRTLETGLKPTRSQALETEFLTGKFRGATEQAYKNAQALTAQVSALEASAAAAKKLALAEEGATKMQADWARQTALGTAASNEATVAYERQNGSLKLLTEAKYADVLADAKRRDAVLLSAKIEQDAIKASEAAITRRASLIKSAPQKLTSFGSAATLGVTLPVAAGAIYASNQAGGFEQNLNLLQAGTGATADMMAKVSAKAIELGRDLQLPATSAQDAARSMLVATQNGLALGDAMEADRGILQLSAAANIDQAESAQLVARTLNSFKMAGGEATKVADLFAASQTKAGVSAENLNSGLSQSSASFSSAHQDLGMLVTELDLLNRANITGEESGTGLKQAMLKLQVPTKDSKAILSELKVSLYDASGQMRPFNEFVNDMGHALEGTTQKERDFVIGKVFGARALRVMNVLLNEGADGYQKMHDKVTQAGVASDIAAARMKGLQGSEEALKSASETLALEIGTHWLPTETAAIRGTAEFINTLDKANPALASLTGVIIGGTAAIGPAAFAVGQMVFQYRNLTAMQALVSGTSKGAAAGIVTEGSAAATAATEIETLAVAQAALNTSMETTAVASVGAESGLTGIGAAAGSAAVGGLAAMSLALFDIYMVTKDIAMYSDLFKNWSPMDSYTNQLGANGAPTTPAGERSAIAYLTKHPDILQAYGYKAPEELSYKRMGYEEVDFSPGDYETVAAAYLNHPNKTKTPQQIMELLGIAPGQIRAAQDAKRLAIENRRIFGDEDPEAFAHRNSGYATTGVKSGSFSGIDALMDGSGGAKESAASKMIRQIADTIDTPANQPSCAYFASKLLNGLGKTMPVTGSAKGLADYVSEHGGKPESIYAAKPGDLIVYHGAGYGAKGSGYHVEVALGGGQEIGSHDGKVYAQKLYDPAHATAYRLPGTFKADAAVLGAQQDAMVDTYRNYAKTIDALTEIDENRKHKPVYSLSHLPKFNSPSGKPTPIGHDFFAEDQQAKAAALADDMIEQMTQIDEIAKRNGSRGVWFGRRQEATSRTSPILPVIRPSKTRSSRSISSR